MKHGLEKLIGIEDLLDPANIDKLKRAIDIIQRAQDKVSEFTGKEHSEKMSILKIGTTLTMAVFSKAQDGKMPTGFTKEDWEDIVNHVSKYAVKADDTKYSAYVFMLYAAFIEASAAQIAALLPAQKLDNLLALSGKIKSKTAQLEKEEVREVDYIDDCLWICLEAMIKLVSGTIDAALRTDRKQVVEAAMMLGMEYARFVLYQKEHALLTEYLQNQNILDVELAIKYDEFLEELNEQAAQFELFIDKAFEPGFGDMLINSVNLARAAGVEESKILKTTKDIDDFFM